MKNKITVILAAALVIALIGWGVTAAVLMSFKNKTEGAQDVSVSADASGTQADPAENDGLADTQADAAANEDTPGANDEKNIDPDESVSKEADPEPANTEEKSGDNGKNEETGSEKDSETKEPVNTEDAGKADNDSEDKASSDKDSDKSDKSGKDDSKGNGSKDKDDSKDTKKPEKDTYASGGLHVDGTHLADKNGNALQLRGVSTHGLAWFPDYVNQALFNELANDWGANVVRLAMYTEEYGGYCSGGDKDALKKLIKNGVKYAANAGMYVIVDWHILSDNSPEIHKDEAKTFFKEMSKDLAGYDNVIYELCNEPNGGTTWSTIKSYAEEIIPVIRKNAPNALIVVGTPTWSQEVDKAAADPITKYDNIAYTLHFYAATHKDDLRKKCENAVKSGLPIFVTEFGICDASGNGSIDEKSANEWIKLLDKYGISYVCWNLANKNEASSLFLSSCTKTSGFTNSDLSDEGKWLKKVLTKRAGKKMTFEEVPENKEDEQAQDSGKKETTEKKEEKKEAKAPKDITAASGDLALSGNVVSSWEENGKSCVQYNLTVKNEGAPVSGWEITVTFDKEIEVANSWNCTASASGKTLTIKNNDNNKNLGTGDVAKDMGVIIKK